LAEQKNNNIAGEVEGMQEDVAATIKIKQGIKYMSVDDLADMLGLSKSTVYQMLRSGRIEGAFRINRSWRIPVEMPALKRG
jgi:excisionase family DNA binding protein